MPISLSKEYRKLLEKVTAQARITAESASRAALENLAVHENEYRGHMSFEQRLLRNRLRARGRALGDALDKRTGIQEIHHLSELTAYEHWHRLLFTRFLTENHLLITDESHGSVPITLEECEELAPGLGARDGLDLACRFASLTLPGVFRRDDPVLELSLASNDQVKLRKLLVSLPAEIFRADDSLGWTYQFWQAQRKREVNESGKKIGADELSPVTQLFTEDYMVEFLLHNTIGAWWAGKRGPIIAANEAEARAQVMLPSRDGVPALEWSYLRFVQDEATCGWLPAAGTFAGWPKSAREIRLLDPCMGSGHFLVFALPLLVRLRMEEEDISAPAAVVAVLQDNIHGLELDERCTQIAAFNVALTAWKLAGYQALPALHLACSGLAPRATEAEWTALAGNDYRACKGMERLHKLFTNAPVLGSLINPRSQDVLLYEAEYHELAPILEQALAQETKDDNVHEMAVIACGLAKAAELLAAQFTIVITNVPYLTRGKQHSTLRDYCEEHYSPAKNDLATVFLDRCLELCGNGGMTSIVLPHNWLFLSGYQKFREKLLKSDRWHFIARLGENGFDTISGGVVRVILITISPGNERGGADVVYNKSERCGIIHGIDVSEYRNTTEKATALLAEEIKTVEQAKQLLNPDARVTLEDEGSDVTQRLMHYTKSIQGLATSDDPQFTICYWELPAITTGWCGLMGTVMDTMPFGGREQLILWEGGQGRYYRHAMSLKEEGRMGGWKSGTEARDKRGVLISQMRQLPVTLYLGEFYDHNACVFIPEDQDHLSAIWAFCESEEFNTGVRAIDQSLKPSNNTLTKVFFDLAHWQKIAAEKYPDGLPKPHSDDPTQWLFSGHPKGSEQPLHVAVARLLGYHWPRQTGSDFPDCPALGPDGLEAFADNDGIVCLPPINHEQPAAARLRQLLSAALGTFDERTLIASAGLKGSKSSTLDEWLRDEFFEQHAKLFHDRPFIWHLWDGRADGFHVLVNYHRLDHAMLQKLTYSYLGNWIQQQTEDAKAEIPGAALRLGAALQLQNKLIAILNGEAPLDIFVRWKSIKEQAQGWHPDINDGVRQNIRPFLYAGDVGKKGAGLFRTIPLALKEKDRGTEPQRPQEEYPWFWCETAPGTDPEGGKKFVGNRWNNVHLTLARKQKANK